MVMSGAGGDREEQHGNAAGGPRFEDSLLRSMLISHGDQMIFPERPIRLFRVALSLSLIFPSVPPAFRSRRREILARPEL